MAVDVPTAAGVAGLMLLAELPDKSLVASVALGARLPVRWVLLGVSAAFVVHVSLAVAAGGVLGLLPHALLAVVSAVLFAAGAVLLLRERRGDPDVDPLAPPVPVRRSPLAAVGASFGVVFAMEWGDVTQVATANLAARYDDPLSVGLGAATGLVGAAVLAVLGGRALLRRVPERLVRRASASVLLVLAVVSLVSAFA